MEAGERIGHVIHVSDEVKKEIAARGGLGLELCLSCNVHAQMITGGFEAHHFGEWRNVEECVVVLSVSPARVSSDGKVSVRQCILALPGEDQEKSDSLGYGTDLHH